MTSNQQDAFYQSFKTPAAHQYPAVYWFWQHVPQPQQIEEQLSEIKHAGYRTFLIQPRLAFPRHQYLGVEYLEAYRYALRVARELGMTAGLYDEYNWISGHAGGRTVEGHDHLRERHLFWSTGYVINGKAACRVSGIHNCLGDGLGEAFMQWCYEGGEARWDGWQIYRVFAFPGGYDVPVNVSAHSTIHGDVNGCRVEVNLPDALPDGCQVIAFVNARCLSSCLVNYLHPETAARFIAVNYEPYRQALGDFFGNPLSFLFFDQPYAGFYTWNERTGSPLNSLMFDESLPQIFAERRGYPLEHALLDLVDPTTAGSARLRCDFYQTYGALARERFLKPVADWAQQHGLEVAGHELLSYVGEWGFVDGLPALDSRGNFGADYFAIDEYKTISTVDACNYHPQVSARFGASQARAHGRKACIVEQYSVPLGRTLPAPAGQWDLTLEEMRSQAIRHLLFGASQFLFHAYSQTNESDAAATPLLSARFDFPPGINYEPWFRFHPVFAEELGRLGAFQQEADPPNAVAVLYPLRTYWYAGPDHPFNEESRFWNRWLSEEGIGYDIIDERQLDARNGILPHLSGYRVLILPGVSVLHAVQVADTLETFLQTGNLVIGSGPLPSAIQARESVHILREQIERMLNAYPNFNYYTDWHAAENDDHLAGQIKGLLGQMQIEALDALKDPIWSWQGVFEGGKALAFFNDTSEPRLVQLTTPETSLYPERCDPATGECAGWGWYTESPENSKIYLPVKARELACLRLLKTELMDTPHLLALDGNAHLFQARLDEHGALDLELDCFEPGSTSLTLNAAAAPQVQPGLHSSSVTALPDNRWQVNIEIPALPLPQALESGWTLRIPHEYHERPVDICKGWEEGYPTYAGSGYYRCHFVLKEEDLLFSWQVRFARVETALVAYLNKQWVGACGWQPYQLDFPQSALESSYNQFEVAVWNTAGNAFYHDTPYEHHALHPAGLVGAPGLHPFVRVIIKASSERQV